LCDPNGIEDKVQQIYGQQTTYYFLFIDIIGSAKPSLGLKAQIRKLIVFIDIVNELLSKYNSVYTSYTGDGCLVCFDQHSNHYSATVLEFCIELHKKTAEYNKDKDQNNILCIRTGITFGTAVKLENNVNSLWGKNHPL
jgi:class 3 adenylate cyclase